MTNSSYIAHTALLFIYHGVLRVTDMYKLKLLKFYCKLSYNLFLSYFDNYSETLEQKPIHDLRQNLIHGPLINVCMQNVTLCYINIDLTISFSINCTCIMSNKILSSEF